MQNPHEITQEEMLRGLESFVLWVHGSAPDDPKFALKLSREDERTRSHALAWASGFMFGAGSDEHTREKIMEEVLFSFLKSLETRSKDYLEEHDLTDLHERWSEFLRRARAK